MNNLEEIVSGVHSIVGGKDITISSEVFSQLSAISDYFTPVVTANETISTTTSEGGFAQVKFGSFKVGSNEGVFASSVATA